MHEGINEIPCPESRWIKSITKHNPGLSSPDLMFVSPNDTEYMNSLAEDAPACFSGAEMQIVFQFDASEGKEEVLTSFLCSSMANNAPRSELWTPCSGVITLHSVYIYFSPLTETDEKICWSQQSHRNHPFSQYSAINLHFTVTKGF